jgi:hypothetical protein
MTADDGRQTSARQGQEEAQRRHGAGPAAQLREDLAAIRDEARFGPGVPGFASYASPSYLTPEEWRIRARQEARSKFHLIDP